MRGARIILIGLLIFNFFIHVPFLTHPALDSETSYYYSAKAIADNHFNPFTATYEEKPPLMFMVPSIFIKLWPHMIWGRIEMLIAATIALLYVYLITEFVSSSFVGLLTVVLCMFFPLFMIQSVFFSDAMPQTAVFLTMLYYFITRHKTGYLISASLAVLTKEPMACMPLMLFFFACIFNFLKKRTINRTALLKDSYLLLPLLVFFLWLLLNKVFFGYYFYPGNEHALFPGNKPIDQLLTSSLNYILTFAQLANGAVIYLIGIPLYIGYYALVSKQKYRNIEILSLFFAIIGIYLLFYANFFWWSMRYVLFLYPLVFILFAYVIRAYCSKYVMGITIAGVCFLFCFYQWQVITTNPQYIEGDAEDIRFIAQQQYIKKAIQQIQAYGKGTSIFTDYQLAHYLWNPLFGYVSSPSDNVFQLSDSNHLLQCPTCTCDQCVSPDELPHQKKILIVYWPGWLNYTPSTYSTLLITITPDWPKNALDKIYLYEYYNPNPQ